MPVEVQFATRQGGIPPAEQIVRWAEAAMGDEPGEACVRIVDAAEARDLNARYRGRNEPTNVLSFAADLHTDEIRIYGDLVICAPVVVAEAQAQGKRPADHFAHMVVHGVLHLRGYDHAEDEQAAVMEALEVQLLGALGVADPYVAA